jgi:hypothetical protein
MSEHDGALSDGALSAPRSPLVTRARDLYRRTVRYLQPNATLLTLHDALQPLRGTRPGPGAPVVAIECVEDPFYFALFAVVCDQLRASAATRIELIVVRSVNGAVGRGAVSRAMRSTLVGRYISRQWTRAFRGLADRVGYRSQSLRHPFADLIDWWRSGSIWRRARSDAAAFAQLQMDGIQVGDLIIDSYLRLAPSARFQPRDAFVRMLVWQVCRDLRCARAYFQRRRPLRYLTSYTTYVEHGVAVRVALQQGIPVTAFGSLAQFGKSVSREDWFHTPDASNYRARFAALDRQDERLAEADRQLGMRLGGGIDAATSYMRASAYRGSAAAVPQVAGATVVFLHDFYDSVHVYPDLVFDDFWSWVCFTIEALQAAGAKFFVKPHPNQIEISAQAFTELRQRYPQLPLIPTGVTNLQLATAGMSCGVTMYGSVAHELAYLGVPSLACARHPHSSFDFCRTAASLDEYAQLLRTRDQLPASKVEMRRQALAFFYMQNLYAPADELALRGHFRDVWKVCRSVTPRAEELHATLAALRDAPEFRERVAALRGARGPDGG